MTSLHKLHELGQSIWYDFISRDFIASGKMKELVDLGIRGMTSNPTIFEQAISKGNAYDTQIKECAALGATTAEIATELFITDVRDACDVMQPVHDSSSGMDGFISIEVSPKLATNTDATIAEARALWQAIDRPNLMIKIPATPEGIPAIRTCIAEGLSVNITLMFSLQQYRDVAEAYLTGLEDRIQAGKPINTIHSVASVFVSRIDSMIDAELQVIGTDAALGLRGKAGVANTKLVYRTFLEIFSGDRWERIAKNGGNLQRPLWASTSTKDPSYPDLLYIDTLIGPHTVNTVPPATLDGILDHVVPKRTVDSGLGEAAHTIEELTAVGINVDTVMAALLTEGVGKFEKSFDSLFEKLEAKRAELAST